MVAVTAKLKSASHEISLPDESTVADLQTAIFTKFELDPATTSVRILHKGKAVKSDDTAVPLATVGIATGAKLMLMASQADQLKQLADAKPERMRGFEEDDRRIRTGSSGTTSGSHRPAASSSAGPVYRFYSLQPLRVLPPGASPAVAAAEALLVKLSKDPGILHVMKLHKFQVGRLSEMPPEGLVGVSASCTMGLNKNKGEEILLRLRTDDWAGLRPYTSLIPVMLHELTHNVHSDHDGDFKALCSQLTKEYKEYMGAHESGRSLNGVDVAPSRPEPVEEADRGHVLGGAGGGMNEEGSERSAREAAARAAAFRFGQACACGACEECAVCVE